MFALPLHDVGSDVSNAAFSAHGFPADFAGFFVEGEEIGFFPRDLPADASVLLSAAGVERHDQKIVMQDGGSAQAVLAVELHFAMLPEDVAVFRGKCDNASIAKDGEDPLAIGGGCGSGVGITLFFAERMLPSVLRPLGGALKGEL